MNNQKGIIIIAVSIILAALILGSFFYAARSGRDTVRVVGYAVNQFEADIVKWSFNLTAITSLQNLADGYRELNTRRSAFEKIWEEQQIEVDEMGFLPVSIYKQYGEYGVVTGYNLEQNVYIISRDLDAVEKIAINPAKFTDAGLSFEYSNLQYFSSRLPEIKQELLAAATVDARRRAEEIVNAAQGKIKKMITARAGVFQITEPLSTEVAGYGLHQTNTRKQAIRVTVTAEFLLE